MDVREEFARLLKDAEIEGARRMQNAIIALLAASGQIHLGASILALKPEDVCKGESIKETVTVRKP